MDGVTFVPVCVHALIDGDTVLEYPPATSIRMATTSPDSGNVIDQSVMFRVPGFVVHDAVCIWHFRTSDDSASV